MTSGITEIFGGFQVTRPYPLTRGLFLSESSCLNSLAQPPASPTFLNENTHLFPAATLRAFCPKLKIAKFQTMHGEVVLQLFELILPGSTVFLQ